MLLTRTRILFLTATVAIGCGAGAATDRGTADRAPSGSAGPATPPVSRADTKNPCDLVSRAELESVLKAPLAEGQQDRSTCTYDSAGEPVRPVEIDVDWTEGRETMEAWRIGAGMVAAVLPRDSGQSVVSSDDLTGLGDEAIFTTAGFQPFLSVRKGDTAFTLKAWGASRKEMIAIARVIGGRLL